MAGQDICWRLVNGEAESREGQNQRCGQVKYHHLIIFVLLKKPQQNGKERDRGLSEKGW